jgi:hypothetical protein
MHLPLPGTAIYEITNKDHLPLRMPKEAFDLAVVELAQVIDVAGRAFASSRSMASKVSARA